jgi:hypothetical protein
MGGNSDDHFSRNSINAGSREDDGGWGPGDDFGHIDAKINRKGLKSEPGLGNEQTLVDRPVIASDKRAKRSSADETYPWGENLYGGPNSRQEK